MAIIALQGLRGGVGTTSITAALAWGLQQLGESVLVIDVTPANLLRMHFNTDFTHTNGWARAEFDGAAWQDAALRYTDLLDFLPFGQISADEHAQFFTDIHRWTQWAQNISALRASGRYNWILLDVPNGMHPLTQHFTSLADGVINVIVPDTNCHTRLHQQALPQGTFLLANQLLATSKLQEDIYQLWLQSLPSLLPMVIHRDESMAEASAAKQPVGEYYPHSLATEEIMTLANWCLLHFDADGNVADGSVL